VESGETFAVTCGGKPVMELVPPRLKGGLDLGAAAEFMRQRGIKEWFPYVAKDFDNPLPEDFLLRPLPEL